MKKTSTRKANYKHPQFRLGYWRGYTAGKKSGTRELTTIRAALESQIDFWRARYKSALPDQFREVGGPSRTPGRDPRD